MSRDPLETKYKRGSWSGDLDEEDMSPSVVRETKAAPRNWRCETEGCNKEGTGSHGWWREQGGPWLCVGCQATVYNWRHHNPAPMEKEALMKQQEQQVLLAQAKRAQVELEYVAKRAEAADEQVAQTLAQLPGFCPITRCVSGLANGQGPGGPGAIRHCEPCNLKWEAPYPILGLCFQCGGNVTDAGKPEPSNDMEID